jgi:hypothetical protein
MTTTTANLNDNVFVISFLGDTASGKSFLANHLLGVQSFVFDKNKNEHDGPTTANVTCFEFEPNNIQNGKENNNCLVLDFEGENGTWFPSIMRRLVDFIYSPEGAKKRRDAVEKYFPTLAYLLSNVIILMSQDDLFANSRYIDRAKKFAAQAVGTVQQNMYKPVLILVQNNYADKNVLSPEDATKKFYKTHRDVKDLESFFSLIRCIIIPHKHAETSINSNQIFDTQVTALRKLLISINTEHQSRLLPYYPWLLLTQNIIKKLSNDEIVNVQISLKDALMKKKHEKEDDIILDLFHRLYGSKNICSTRWFLHCRRFAMDVLARFTALRFPYYEHVRFHEMIENECKTRLKDLWKTLDEYRPCEALYMGEGHVKEKNRPVFCYQSKGSHKRMNQHQTSEVVYGASWWQALFERFLRPTIDKWNGPFETSDTTSNNPSDDMYKMLIQTTKAYLKELKNSPLGNYLTFKRLLKKWNVNLEFEDSDYNGLCYCCLGLVTSNENSEGTFTSIICFKCHEDRLQCTQDESIVKEEELSSTIEKDECVICMSSKREVLFDPCFHYYFCQACAKTIKDKFKSCPVCKREVKNIRKVNG